MTTTPFRSNPARSPLNSRDFVALRLRGDLAHHGVDSVVQRGGIEAGEQFAQRRLIQRGLDPEAVLVLLGHIGAQDPIAANDQAPARTAEAARAKAPISV